MSAIKEKWGKDVNQGKSVGALVVSLLDEVDMSVQSGI